MALDALARQRRGAIRTQQAMGAARPQIVPAPVGGLNARDSEDNMSPLDALKMDNFTPGFGSVNVREGYSAYASGVGSASSSVQTIATFISGSTSKLIAAANGSIFDISTTGTASSLASGFSANRWQTANFNGLMGLVNGTDTPQQFNGTTVSSLTVSGSGLTSTDLIGITVFKNRSYFWEDDSQDFWYSALDTLGAGVSKFPLSRVGDFGGKLVAINSMARDGGDGPDDLFVAVMSSGDVIVYQGTDPNSASTWQIVGVYRSSPAVDVRAVVKVGGDLILVTRAGYVSVAQLMQFGSIANIDPNLSFGSKINPLAREKVENNAANTGWQAILGPESELLLFNIPTSSTTFEQHVFNLGTKAWGVWKDIPSYSWGKFNGNYYFGGLGAVYQIGGNDDNGTAIKGDCQQAFSQLGVQGVRKLITAVQPALRGSGDLTLRIGVNTDFATQPPVTVQTTFGEQGTFWEDEGTFWEDADRLWNEGENGIIDVLTSAGGQGFRIAPRLIVDTSNSVEWLSTRIIYKAGGVR